MEFPFEQPKKPQPRQSAQAKKRRSGKHSIRAGSSRVIARATMIAMIGFFMAKVTGFMREVLIIPKLGYGMYSDPYYIAFMIPDLLYELLIGGAVAAAITPTLSAGIEQNQERRVWRSVSIFISVAGTVMVGVLALTALLMPWLVPAMNPNKDLEVIRVAIPLSQILLIQCFVMTLIALTQGVLTAYKRFGLASFGLMLYNICYMFVLIYFGAPTEEAVKKVAFGVVASAFVYFIYQLTLARREIGYFRFRLDWHDPGFKRLLRLAIPTLLSGSVLHINGLIMNAFTDQFTGAITSIRQASQTFLLPYGVISLAVGSVMLPNLTGFYSQRNYPRVRSLYTSSLRYALFLTTPFAIIFAVLNFDTIQTIFQWNAQGYTNQEVAVTGQVLRWFCISLLTQTVVFITNQAFYARKVTRLALVTGLITLVLNPVFCVLYTRVFDFGVQGIAMAHASYSLISSIVLFSLYKIHKPQARPFRILPFVLRLIYCGAITALVLMALRTLPFQPQAKAIQLLVYVFKSGIGLATFFVAGISIQLREAVQMQSKLLRFLGRA